MSRAGCARLAEQVRRRPTTEDHGEFGVKLGERRAKRALAGRVGTTPKVAGDGKRDMRNEVSEVEITHRDAVRLLSRFARYRGSVSSAVHRPKGPAPMPPGIYPS